MVEQRTGSLTAFLVEGLLRGDQCVALRLVVRREVGIEVGVGLSTRAADHRRRFPRSAGIQADDVEAFQPGGREADDIVLG